MKIVGILGFKGSGKDTAANALIEDGYVKMAVADTLKDVLSSMFVWPRHMLEGDTQESRVWREQVDPWWSARLGIPNFTPRLAMTSVGTDVIRTHFHQDIWLSSVERKIESLGYEKIVITDCRFENEVNLIKNYGGTLIRVRKGPEPVFFRYSQNVHHPDDTIRADALQMMSSTYASIHPSEWRWNCITPDVILDNDGTIDDLHTAIRGAV
jgi:hypothetical protein